MNLLNRKRSGFCGLSRGAPPINAQSFFAAVEDNQLVPGAIWQGSPNYWTGRFGHDVIAICDHIMQSTIESANSWFRNPGSEASSHLGIAKTGKIYQWVALNNSAWANGIINSPETAIPSVPWVLDDEKNGINPNTQTVSIEHEGLTGEPMPEAQYQATLSVHRFLIKKYSLPLDRLHIIGHFQVDNINRHYCPGNGFPWQRLMADLQADPKPSYPAWVWNGIEVNDEYGFLTYHTQHGGVPIFGYPLKPAAFDPKLGVVVQWFERARFEYHAGVVQLGLLGRELTGIY